MHNALAIDVFAGGLAVGVRKYFNVLAHLEHSDYGSNVVKLNHPETPIYNHRDKWPRTPVFPGQKQRTRFICANPPCAPFSSASAGRATAWHQDPRLQMFQDSVDMLPDVQPDVLAIESVTNAWFVDSSFGRGLARQAARDGYATTVLLHNAQSLGVPQSRKRVFYVFHKIKVAWPEPDFTQRITVRQAWKGLKIPASSKKQWNTDVSLPYREIAKHTRPGEDCSKAFDRLYPNPERNERGQVKGRPSFLMKRMHYDRPSYVVLGEQKMIHPEETRVLYPEELAALVGFPRDYKWPTDVNLSTIALMMSQGVSPLVGEWLAQGVANSITSNVRLNQPFLAVQDLRDENISYTVIDENPEDWKGPDRFATSVATASVPATSAAPRRAENKASKASSTPLATTGSGAYIREMLLEGKLSPNEIVAKVMVRFPGRKTSTSDVAWNKGKLRKQGLLT